MGSFSIFPVSSIVFNVISFPSNFIFVWHSISFLVILFFEILNAIIIITVPSIAPKKIVFNTYVPTNIPFFIIISCGFITYIKYVATPPKVNVVK